MLNWPGTKGPIGRPSSGVISMVAVSSVSCFLPTTRKGRGIIGSAATLGEAVASSALAPIHIQHLQPRRLHPLDQHRNEPLHQVPAEFRVLFALAPQADGVESNGARPLQGPGIEC